MLFCMLSFHRSNLLTSKICQTSSPTDTSENACAIKMHIFKSSVLSSKIFSKTSSHSQYIFFLYQHFWQIGTPVPFLQSIKHQAIGICFSPVCLNLKNYFWGILGQSFLYYSAILSIVPLLLLEYTNPSNNCCAAKLSCLPSI